MVEERAARLPTPEVCDGLDNDCNGKVDELFDLLNDARNCGGCGISCGIGVKCDQRPLRRAATAPTLPPPPAGDGGGGQVQIGICPPADGETTCVDLHERPRQLRRLRQGLRRGHVLRPGQLRVAGQAAGRHRPPAGHPAELPAAASAGRRRRRRRRRLPGRDARRLQGRRGRPLLHQPALRQRELRGLRRAPARRARSVATGAAPATRGTGEGGGTAPAPACREPFKLCSDPFGGSHCSDLLRDPRNCGGCGIVCEDGHRSAPRASAWPATMPPPPTCPPPTTTCAGRRGRALLHRPLPRPRQLRGLRHALRGGDLLPRGQVPGGHGAAAHLLPAPDDLQGPPTGRLYCTDTFRDPGNCGGLRHRLPRGQLLRRRPLPGGRAAAPALRAAQAALPGPARATCSAPILTAIPPTAAPAASSARRGPTARRASAWTAPRRRRSATRP